MFTDGISEAMNADSHLYGHSRLAAAIGRHVSDVASLGRGIIEDIKGFVAGRSQSNDMCLICVGREYERSPSIAPLAQLARQHTPVSPEDEINTAVAEADSTQRDAAFSSQTIVTQYPAPIAIAYRRFYQETEPRLRLDALFCVLEASVRYLVTLGVSDLLHCQSGLPEENWKLLDHAEYEFLRNSRPMPLGKWIASLRETARTLGSPSSQRRVIQELHETCRPGGHFDADLLKALVDQRNDCAHPDGSIRIPAEKCRDAVREFRPVLEEALREIRFVCRYPLGFLSPFAGLAPPPGQHYYHLHSCMGAWIGTTSRRWTSGPLSSCAKTFPSSFRPTGSGCFISGRFCSNGARNTPVGGPCGSLRKYPTIDVRSSRRSVRRRSTSPRAGRLISIHSRPAATLGF